jgi:hypothetical protein
MEHSAQRKPNRLVQMRIYCKATRSGAKQDAADAMPSGLRD